MLLCGISGGVVWDEPGERVGVAFEAFPDQLVPIHGHVERLADTRIIEGLGVPVDDTGQDTHRIGGYQAGVL